MSSVYVDTSALLALLDSSDRDHASVVAAVRQLANDGAELVTTSHTLVETGALAKRRLGAEAFRRLGAVVDRSMQVVWVHEALHRDAWSRASGEPRRGPSLVDWVGFLVMRELRLDTVLALDHHFETQGFRRLPDRISTR